MSERRPSYEDRKRALDENMKGHREHVVKQGGIPSHYEIEKFHREQAEKVDRRKGW